MHECVLHFTLCLSAIWFARFCWPFVSNSLFLWQFICIIMYTNLSLNFHYERPKRAVFIFIQILRRRALIKYFSALAKTSGERKRARKQHQQQQIISRF